ncbi:hypothetical protein RRG08_048845, partial [Elysia crispata]
RVFSLGQKLFLLGIGSTNTRLTEASNSGICAASALLSGRKYSRARTRGLQGQQYLKGTPFGSWVRGTEGATR